MNCAAFKTNTSSLVITTDLSGISSCRVPSEPADAGVNYPPVTKSAKRKLSDLCRETETPKPTQNDPKPAQPQKIPMSSASQNKISFNSTKTLKTPLGSTNIYLASCKKKQSRSKVFTSSFKTPGNTTLAKSTATLSTLSRTPFAASSLFPSGSSQQKKDKPAPQ